MVKSVKHSKIKNTGLLFELLTRQLTADIMNDVKDSVANKLIETYFRKNSPLGKEYLLYQTLLKYKFSEESKAMMLIDEVIQLHKKINKTELRNSKFNLIREIKENYNTEDFFKTRMENYKICASIYKLFQAKSLNEDYSASDIVNAKVTIVEHIMQKNVPELKEEDPDLAEYEKLSKDIRLLAYKGMVNKFNSKYEVLGENQRKLIKRFINHVTNSESLSSYLAECAESVQVELKEYVKRIDNQVTKIKINEVVNQLSTFGRKNNPSDDEVLAMLNIYELVDEIKLVVGENKNVKR